MREDDEIGRTNGEIASDQYDRAESEHGTARLDGRSETHVGQLAKEGERKRAALIAMGWRHCMAAPEGRAALWHLIGWGEPFSTGFDKDAALMAFKAGGRNHALRLWAELQRVAPDEFALMQRENVGQS